MQPPPPYPPLPCSSLLVRLLPLLPSAADLNLHTAPATADPIAVANNRSSEYSSEFAAVDDPDAMEDDGGDPFREPTPF